MGFSATRKGIKLFNPLAMLLYWTTHREVLNMVKLLNGMVLYEGDSQGKVIEDSLPKCLKKSITELYRSCSSPL
ncbi:hypothetical protein [Prevotella disiens]|jgi:type III restriction enzyme, res subunit|uniref:Uncharacterized protein n=2 Tax=Prevotella disiens TaxID=28130 RepID=A0A3E4QME0_9BACT|nr:hypothetical protein [Prevotella disiens]ERJ72027.1 hypothetical protein HMPREF0653_02486 [Prevotella disiens JCM 6334 = ATCC 29426]RGL05393.1 hypothetical protein DXC89_01415 [Prevotella disiens]